MGKYTDDEIRAMPKITAKIAADYLGISPMMVTLGMRNNVLPIGFAIKKEDRYSESWSYNIIPERLIAYNHGKINEVQVQNIEKNLNTIISQFEGDVLLMIPYLPGSLKTVLSLQFLVFF